MNSTSDRTSLKMLIRRAAWPLAIKALPALYGAGLVLFVIRVLPTAEFGRYGIAFAYVNFAAGLSRGLWLPSLITQAARGRSADVIVPVLRTGFLIALAGATGSLLILPKIGCGYELAGLTSAILIILVPRDFALGILQAEGRSQRAFSLEATYFVGSLAGFTALAVSDYLRTAGVAMSVNVIAAFCSAGLGLVFVHKDIARRNAGNMSLVLAPMRSLGTITLSDMGLQQGDTLMAGFFLSPATVAPYIAARTVIRLYTLFSQAVNFVLLPAASRMSAAGDFARIRTKSLSVLGRLLLFLLPLNIAVWVLSPWFLGAILGSKYALAVPFLRVLLIVTFFEPVYSMVTNVMVGCGLAHRFVRISLAGVGIDIALLFGALALVGLEGAAYSVVIAYLFLALASIHTLNRMAKPLGDTARVDLRK